jgi:hypothetical protein
MVFLHSRYSFEFHLSFAFYFIDEFVSLYSQLLSEIYHILRFSIVTKRTHRLFLALFTGYGLVLWILSSFCTHQGLFARVDIQGVVQ